MKLGFIGLGIMGTPMAINLARAGHQLHVTTIGPVADELLSLGAVSVETARQVTEASDIIFIMVPDTPQVEEVLFGENGCTKASLKGKTIVDMSSISPIETKRFARQVNELGGDYLDAPVSGGEIGAREGTLSIMVGGDEAVFERVKPLFELLGKNITLVGGNGDGQTCKVADQIIVALNIEAVSEALLFASKAGADPGSCAPDADRRLCFLTRIPEVHGERMIKRTFNPRLQNRSAQKISTLALQSAESTCAEPT